MIMRGLDDEDTVMHLPIGDPPDPYPDYDEPDDDTGAGDDVDEEDEEGEPDVSELDALLAEATAATAEEKRLKQARKRLVHISKHGHASKAGEQEALLEEIRRLEGLRVWHTVGAVALFHVQECIVCGSRHSFFKGWMTEQKHLSDPNARRLVAGKPVERLPERREDHFQGQVELCSNCVESQLAMNIAFGEAPGEL